MHDFLKRYSSSETQTMPHNRIHMSTNLHHLIWGSFAHQVLMEFNLGESRMKAGMHSSNFHPGESQCSRGSLLYLTAPVTQLPSKFWSSLYVGICSLLLCLSYRDGNICQIIIALPEWFSTFPTCAPVNSSSIVFSISFEWIFRVLPEIY